jgi:hypothetical protein
VAEPDYVDEAAHAAVRIAMTTPAAVAALADLDWSTWATLALDAARGVIPPGHSPDPAVYAVVDLMPMRVTHAVVFDAVNHLVDPALCSDCADEFTTEVEREANRRPDDEGWPVPYLRRKPCLTCRVRYAYGNESRCDPCRLAHQRQRNATRDRARGTRQARGYDAPHDAYRREVTRRLDAGSPSRVGAAGGRSARATDG